MRLHLRIKAQNVLIPYDHQHLLVGVINKWLGTNNTEHGQISLYSFSRIEGGKAQKNGILFEQEARFFISFYDEKLVKQLVGNILDAPDMFNNFQVKEVIIEEDPDLSNRNLFFTASPIFIKRRNKDKIEYIFFDDPRSSSFLKETLETKMEIAGIEDKSLAIHFDHTYPQATTKLITYKGIKNKANWCPVIINAEPSTKLFAWKVGLGNCTGIGFGAIK